MASPPRTPPDLKEAFDLHGRGQLEAAEQKYRAVLERTPDNFHALHMLGVIHLQRGQNTEAADRIGAALKINPTDAAALSNRGLALRSLGRCDEALACFDASCAANPSAAATHFNRALTLSDLKRPSEALTAVERALALEPRYAEAHGERGALLAAQGKLDEALAAYKTALAITPNDARILHNYGHALMALCRYDDARVSFGRALAIAPDLAEAHASMGECLLVQGDLRAGFEAYERRWETRGLKASARNFAAATWRGEPVAGKTLLLHAEQGFGDTIQFCRYATMAAARGAHVVLEVPAELTSLMMSLGNCDVIARGTPLPAFDYHAPLLSLPLAFATDVHTIPPAPYLAADPARVTQWRDRLDRSAALRVGVAWSGRPTHLNDRKRSIPLDVFAPLLTTARVQFVSLQKDVRPADEAVLAKTSLISFDAELKDFADTAALVAALDLVITVDTAVAHLAGALGKPVWVMLPHSPDWRWMLNRADTPWYGSMRLFRQPRIGAWPDVMERAAAELKTLS